VTINKVKVKKEYYTFDPNLIFDFAINSIDKSKLTKVGEETFYMNSDEYTNIPKSFSTFGFVSFIRLAENDI